MMLMWGKARNAEHHADQARRRAGRCPGGEGGAVDHDIAGLEGSSPLTHLMRVDLPTRGAADDHHFALGYRRGAVAEHLE